MSESKQRQNHTETDHIMSSSGIRSVNVIAPARLHLGFLDLNGGLGRGFGSIGLYLDEIVTELSLEPAGNISANGPSADRASRNAELLLSHLNLDSGVTIQIKRAIPEHIGLGSGTQMAMAVGMGLNRLLDLQLSTRELVSVLDRGRRSGVGIGAFNLGGFIVDGGRSETTIVPPVIAHSDIPAEWRFILIQDKAYQGIHGIDEINAFEQLPPMDEAIVGIICRLVVMQALPAICEQDCELFGKAISRIQELVGSYFAPVQGGIYLSPAVEQAARLLEKYGATGTGQSSWGPTGFAIYANETDAYHAIKLARNNTADHIELNICKARNRGAGIKIEEPMVGNIRKQ